MVGRVCFIIALQLLVTFPLALVRICILRKDPCELVQSNELVEFDELSIYR